jgi:RHS repeat-associated protein
MNDDHAARPLPLRLLALLLVFGMSLLGCPPVSVSLEPAPGAIDYQRDGWIPFRHGHVNAVGGNLVVQRSDLAIDTHLGTVDVGAVYNSASASWRWSFDSTYGKILFTDETGATHDTSGLEVDEAIPGTEWVRAEGRRIKTKAGQVHTYGQDRRLRWIHWGQASFPRIEFERGPAAAGSPLLSVRQCASAYICFAIYTFSHDQAGRVIAIDDRAGRRAEFSWIGSRIALARSAFEVAEGLPGTQYGYEGGLLSSITTSEGERTEIDYDGPQVISIRSIGTGDPTDTFHYSGKVDGLYTTRHWDACGDERTYTYDAQRRLHEIRSLAVDETTRWTWDGLRPITRIDPDATTRFFTFVGDDLVAEVEPSGNVRTFTYAAGAMDRTEPRHRPLLRVEDDLGLVEEHAYDADGHRISWTNGAGETTSFSYDADGHLREKLRPSGDLRRYELFAENGHAQEIWAPASILPDQHRRFDDVGNRTFGSLGDQPGPGGVSLRGYDAGRNLRSVTLEDGGVMTIDVRSDGQRSRISRPNGDDHEMDYDPLGRLVERRERVEGVWQTTTFEYDAVGNRTALVRPNGMRQELSFDAAGRVVLVRNFRNGVLEGERTLVYQGGRLVASSDTIRGGTEYPTFDAAGRLVHVWHVDGSSSSYGYDARSRRTWVTYVNSDFTSLRTVGFAYDGADREIEIRDGSAVVLARTYEDARLSNVRYGNGFVRTFSYLPDADVLAGSETHDAAGTLIETTSLSRSLQLPAASLEVVTTTAGGVDTTTSETYTLSPFTDQSLFTNRARVTHFEDNAGERDLSYDGKSNLLTEGSTVFTFNAEKNRLLSIDAGAGPPLSYSYDPAGFTTSRGSVPITWMANGRIASHGNDVFAWDVLGNPLSSTVDGLETRMLFDGTVAADGNGVPLRIDFDEVTIDLATGGHLYRHLDFRRNVKFTSDDEGLTRSHYAYSPYGLEEIHGADDDPLRFVARAEVGDLVLMGARVYDPAAARFLSPDPIFQEINQYAYTLGNPIWFHDRDGTHPTPQTGSSQNVQLGNTLVAVGNSLLLTAAILATTGQLSSAAAMALADAILVTIGHLLFMASAIGPERLRSPRRRTRRRKSNEQREPERRHAMEPDPATSLAAPA